MTGPVVSISTEKQILADKLFVLSVSYGLCRTSCMICLDWWSKFQSSPFLEFHLENIFNFNYFVIRMHSELLPNDDVVKRNRKGWIVKPDEFRPVALRCVIGTVLRDHIRNIINSGNLEDKIEKCLGKNHQAWGFSSLTSLKLMLFFGPQKPSQDPLGNSGNCADTELNELTRNKAQNMKNIAELWTTKAIIATACPASRVFP